MPLFPDPPAQALGRYLHIRNLSVAKKANARFVFSQLLLDLGGGGGGGGGGGHTAFKMLPSVVARGGLSLACADSQTRKPPSCHPNCPVRALAAA